jgi:GT2 family glycosyltransferase
LPLIKEIYDRSNSRALDEPISTVNRTEKMLTYSIAIRTLATNPDVLQKELESINQQTVQPEAVMVYIAEGYERPVYTVGREVYVWVKKGMMAQRLLKYDELTSDAILMLDDDVKLAEDSAERMLAAIEEGMDCVAADTFKNQDMSWKQKVAAFLSNFVYARKDDGWAFKQCRNGSFTFNGNPQKSLCLTETFAGPCWMVKKSVLHSVQLENEFDTSWQKQHIFFVNLHKLRQL